MMKLTPLKKIRLVWTLFMLPFVTTDAVLMATKTINQIWGSIIFIIIMLLVGYGNWRIEKKYNVKEARHDRC